MPAELQQHLLRAGAVFGKDKTQEALAVGVIPTHFLLTSGNFLLFLGKEARVKAT